MRASTLLLTFAILFATPVVAISAASEDEIQNAYETSLAARGARRPDIAEQILRDLIDLRPSAPQLRFDLGVVLAEQGRCVAAARAFDAGASIAGTPSFNRERERAMADLCPGLAPFEISGSFSFVYDSNGTNGANDATFNLGGIPFTLDGTSVAREIYGYQASGQAAYNFKINDTSYLVPSVGIAIADYSLDALDSVTASAGVSYRHLGDRIDWRIGPQVMATYENGTHASTGRGLSALAAITMSRRSGLFLSASFLDLKNQANPLLDYQQAAASVEYVRQFSSPKIRLNARLSVLSQDYQDDFQDIDSINASIGVSGTIAPRVGYNLSLGHRLSLGRTENYLFGTKRRDHVTMASAQVSFARFERWYGRPYIGVSHTVSNSNWPTKDFDRTRILIGVTRSF